MRLRFMILLLASLYTYDAFAGIAVGPPWAPPPPPPPFLPTKPPPR
jgi:hypothetical protein